MKGGKKLISTINNEDSVNDSLVELRVLADLISVNCNSIKNATMQMQRIIKLNKDSDIESIMWITTTCAMLVKRDLKTSKEILGKDYLRWVKERLHLKPAGLDMFELLSPKFERALKTIRTLVQTSQLHNKMPNVS